MSNKNTVSNKSNPTNLLDGITEKTADLVGQEKPVFLTETSPVSEENIQLPGITDQPESKTETKVQPEELQNPASEPAPLEKAADSGDGSVVSNSGSTDLLKENDSEKPKLHELDRSKVFGQIIGSSSGAAFEQDGIQFNGAGIEMEAA